MFFVVLGLWSGIRRIRFAPVALLMLQVGWGAWEWVSLGSHESDNPYLRVSAWRPVWAVAVPLAWAILIATTAPNQPAAIDRGEPPRTTRCAR